MTDSDGAGGIAVLIVALVLALLVLSHRWSLAVVMLGVGMGLLGIDTVVTKSWGGLLIVFMAVVIFSTGFCSWGLGSAACGWS